jgi:hypothetical protein
MEDVGASFSFCIPVEKNPPTYCLNSLELDAKALNIGEQESFNVTNDIMTINDDEYLNSKFASLKGRGSQRLLSPVAEERGSKQFT